ncbi:MAG: 50S ribosomal protein L6 [Candidatus Aenigmarchaeota archaeon]|nr:50S ribosomal protein L6 [Candidatus Aenigmarchaeota archaeon]
MEKNIKVPEGVEVSINGFKVKVKGKLGELERDFYNKGVANILKIEKNGEGIKVISNIETKRGKALVGTAASHILNLFEGVTLGYKYTMKILYTHFPITLEQKGNEIIIKNFLGQKGDRKAKFSPEVKIEIKKDDLTITGLDKELVGQAAASLEDASRIKKKDRRRFQDGIFILEKGVGQ